MSEIARVLEEASESEEDVVLNSLERGSIHDKYNGLKLRFDALTERVSKIESALPIEKFEKPNIFDLLV